MSIDLLHTWRHFLVSLVITLAGLIGALFLAKRNRPDLLWAVALGTFLLDMLVSELIQPGSVRLILGWSVGQAVALVLVPVALGGRCIIRLSARGTGGFSALCQGILLGLGVGWVIVPIVLLAAFLGFGALTS